MEYCRENYLFSNVFLSSFLFFSVITLIASINFSKRILSGVLVSMVFFQLGLYVKNQSLNKFIELTTDSDLLSADFYTASVSSLPIKREKSLRLELVINKVYVNNQWHAKKAKVLASFPINVDYIPDLNDQIMIKGAPKRPLKALNPLAFDYSLFLENKGIFFTDFLNENRYSILTQSGNIDFLYLQALKVSKWADGIFRTQIANDRSYGLIKAMILGRRDDLRADQIQDFTMSGVVHILSVSGLHVGVLLLLLTFSFGWIKRLLYGKYIFLVVIISLLVFYAMVTGLPSSVVRATIMFAILLIGNTFGRNNNVVNTLALSALIILVVDPNSIYDIGFQLSYAAMLGIILFFPFISKLVRPRNKLVQFFWDVSVLSLAAQLGTFPITVYYFHQFPVYFLLINPFVIFFANFLIIGPIAMLFFNLISFNFLIEITQFWIELAAYCVNYIAAVPKVLPYNVIVGLYLDKVEVVLLFLVIFLAWYMFHSANAAIIKWLVSVVVIFGVYAMGSATFNYYKVENRVMTIPRHSVMTFKKGSDLYIMADSAFQQDISGYKFHIENYALSLGVTKVSFLNKTRDLNSFRSTRHGDFYNTQGKYYFVGSMLPHGNQLDYILLNKYATGPFEAGKTNKHIMLGGQVYGKKREKMITDLKKSDWRYYELNKGSLIL